MPKQKTVAAVRKFFVAAYFGGKTYASNGIALIRDDPKKPGGKQVVTIASWCGGPDFVIEEWDGATHKEWSGGAELKLADRIWDLVDALARVQKRGSARARRAAQDAFERCVGRKLVDRIHTDPLLS